MGPAEGDPGGVGNFTREEKLGFIPLEFALSCVRKMLMRQEFWNLF